MSSLLTTFNDDTIAAICTPPGRGGVGIVRVSGVKSKEIAEKITGILPKPRFVHYANFKDSDGELLDMGLLLFFNNPHSFTGEDVVEFQGHGGPIVMDALLNQVISLGARLANPGEFSLRAYLNGKIDLVQAEAVADLIDAATIEAQKGALKSLQGAFSEKINQLNTQLIQLRVYVEASIDFPEEEIDFLADDKIVKELKSIEQKLNSIFKTAKEGSLLKEGRTVVIVGEPNVGKSSLLNALAGREAAIVTNIPGTTRDLVKEYLNIDGIPLYLIDTAGFRESLDVVEKEGIKRAQNALNEADFILYCQDAEVANLDALPPYLLGYESKIINIINKVDLLGKSAGVLGDNIFLSAKTGVGLQDLKNYLKYKMGLETTGSAFSARRRHLNALEISLGYIKEAHKQLTEFKAGELLAEELRAASDVLGQITGTFTTEDLLGEIFSSFCIGK